MEKLTRRSSERPFAGPDVILVELFPLLRMQRYSCRHWRTPRGLDVVEVFGVDSKIPQPPGELVQRASLPV